MLKHTRLPIVALGLLSTLACQSASDKDARGVRQDVQLVADATTIQALVPRNATLESLLKQQQLAPEMAASVVDAMRGVFNPRELRADQRYWVTHTLDGLFREFRYQINADELLRVVFREGAASTAAPAFDIERVVLPKQYVRTSVSAMITPRTSSLIGAFDSHGVKMFVPLQLAEIFSGEIDFNSDLQQGDQFNVLFDRAVRDGEVVGYGDIQAAVIQVGTRKLSAFRFADESGKLALYDENGQTLTRQFLRTPMPFDPRVTSGFSTSRLHPVHGIRRAHLGVDFGAPTGTRVLAVAGGVVTHAGWSGEAGRMVRVKHTGGYETLYLHLSGFGPGIKVGARIDQSQVVGYVGMTGTATGPHLDYRVVKDGTFVNPMTAFSRMPAGEPIVPARMPDFMKMRDAAIAEMSASAGTSTSAVAD